MMPSYFFYLQMYFLALENVLRKLFMGTFSIVTLIITNFHLCLIQLWWQFFQIFVNGDMGGIDPKKPCRANLMVNAPLLMLGNFICLRNVFFSQDDNKMRLPN